jgi:hypothetical protein
MAINFIDGFEDLSSWLSAGPPTIVAGRNGNAASVGLIQSLTYVIPAVLEGDWVTMGFAWKLTGASTGTILRLLSDNGGTEHDQLELTSGGAVQVVSNSVPLAVSAPGALSLLNNWYFVEWSIRLHASAGATIVRVNGSEVINATGLATKNGGAKATYDRIVFYNNIADAMVLDDCYVGVSTSTPDAFLGDFAVETLYPSADGAANQWTGSDGNSVNNWQLVDEAVLDTTDYVTDATAGHQDLYTLTDLVRTQGTVLGVCHQAVAAKGDSGARQFKLVNHRTSDHKTAALDLAGTYGAFHYVLMADPDTGAAWTIANVNALQSGVEVV